MRGSVKDLLERDPRFGRLITNFFTLYVGVDVCMTTCEMMVKNADFEILLNQHFDNHQTGFEHLMGKLASLNPDNVYQVRVAIKCRYLSYQFFNIRSTNFYPCSMTTTYFLLSLTGPPAVRSHISANFAEPSSSQKSRSTG